MHDDFINNQEPSDTPRPATQEEIDEADGKITAIIVELIALKNAMSLLKGGGNDNAARVASKNLMLRIEAIEALLIMYHPEHLPAQARFRDQFIELCEREAVAEKRKLWRPGDEE